MQKIPSMTKRNARYRGQRESEKYNLGMNEKIYDIYHIEKDVDSLSEKIKAYVIAQHVGEAKKASSTVTIPHKIEFKATSTKRYYDLITDVYVNSYSNVVLTANGEPVDRAAYAVTNGRLTLQLALIDPKLKEADIVITFNASITTRMPETKGLQNVHHAIGRIAARTNEMERRLQEYENASR